MQTMLDKSPRQIKEYSDRYEFNFWQLRTPLTKYALSGAPYGLDNGCFARFDRPTWDRLLNEAYVDRPVFVCIPDVVGSASRTAELFDVFFHHTNGLPRALVLQDGIDGIRIPWQHIDAVFVGGTDHFKSSSSAMAACRAAKMLGKWVHVGRVNTPARIRQWIGIADSIDGSGISRFDHMLEAVLAELTFEPNQLLLDGAIDW